MLNIVQKRVHAEKGAFGSKQILHIKSFAYQKHRKFECTNKNKQIFSFSDGHKRCNKESLQKGVQKTGPLLYFTVLRTKPI